LEKGGFNNFFSNPNQMKKIFESIFTINNDIRSVDNQTKIMDIIEKFYKNMLEKIKKKFEKLKEDSNRYKTHIKTLDYNFKSNIEDFKLIYSDLNSSDNLEFRVIEKSYNEFKKLFVLFEEKLNYFQINYSSFSENQIKLSEKTSIQQISKDSQIELIKQIHSEIIKNMSSSNVREFTIKIENFWSKNNLKIENFNDLFRLRV
jgi:hypothetical protein